MAVTTVSDIGTALGNAGALGSRAWEATTQSGGIAHRFAMPVEIGRGNTTRQIPRWGALPVAAARTENAAAVTPTTLTSPAAPTAARAKYGLAMGASDEAENATLVENSLVDRVKYELVLANQRYIDYDSLVGMANYLYGQLSVQVGSTGVGLVRQTLITGYNSIAASLGDDIVLVAHIEGYGKAQLHAEAAAAGASIYNQQDVGVLSDELKGLFANRLFGDKSMGAAVTNFHLFSMYGGRLHVFCSPYRAELATNGSDKVGAIYTPYLPGLNGMDAGANMETARVQPTYAIGYRANPVPASEPTMVGRMDVMQQFIRHVLSPRTFAGVLSGVWDIVADATPSELYDASGVGLIYAAS